MAKVIEVNVPAISTLTKNGYEGTKTYAWDSLNLSYSFATAQSDVSNYANSVVQPVASSVTEAQKAAVKWALAEIASVSKLTFNEVQDSVSSDIRIFEHATKPGGGGLGNLPLLHSRNIDSADPYAGDMMIGREMPESGVGKAVPLAYAQYVLGIGGFKNDSSLDNHVVYVPSITSAGRTTTSIFITDPNDNSLYQFGTIPKYDYDGLLAVDIVRVQNMYGANLETEAGNTRYSIAPTLEGHSYQAIWDGSGVDTLTFERETADTRVNLGSGYDLNKDHIPSGTREYKQAKFERLADQIQNGNALDNVLTEANAAQAGAGVDAILVSSATSLAASNGKLVIAGANTDAELAWDGNVLKQAVGNTLVDATFKLQIASLYKVMLGRSEADKAGMDAWISFFEAGHSLSDIATAFSDTVLHKTIYSYNDTAFANEVYRMALGRDASAAEANSIVSSLANGGTRQDVFINLIDSAEFKQAHQSDMLLRVSQTLTGSNQQYVEAAKTTSNFVDSTEVQIAWGTVIENASGGLGDDQITGNDYNNVLSPGALGTDTIDGKGGVDTLRLYESKASYTIAIDAAGVTATSAYGTVTATNIEQVAFSDGIYRIDGNQLVKLDDGIGQIVRLYQGLFDRDTIDTPGLNHWLDYMASGASLETVANGMAEHPYFQDIHDTSNNAAFLESAFKVALGRDANLSERQHWLDQLNSGATSQVGMIVALTESEECKLGQVENTIFHSAVVGTGDASRTQFGVDTVELAGFGINVTQPEYFF